MPLQDLHPASKRIHKKIWGCIASCNQKGRTVFKYNYQGWKKKKKYIYIYIYIYIIYKLPKNFKCKSDL